MMEQVGLQVNVYEYTKIVFQELEQELQTAALALLEVIFQVCFRTATEEYDGTNWSSTTSLQQIAQVQSRYMLAGAWNSNSSFSIWWSYSTAIQQQL
jgi:hypothetical protein